jgi:hypothetical protein
MVDDFNFEKRGRAVLNRTFPTAKKGFQSLREWCSQSTTKNPTFRLGYLQIRDTTSRLQRLTSEGLQVSGPGQVEEPLFYCKATSSRLMGKL